MNFVYPAFLWALLLLIVPIIIHLFHFRSYKTVYFTNVKFLKTVKEASAMRTRIKHLFVLFSRLSALLFLVLAFAMPYTVDKEKGGAAKGNRTVSVYIDNSFSMLTESDDVPLLQKAIRRAEEIITAYGAQDKFQVLTSDFEGKDQRLLSKEDALERIRSIQKSRQSKTISKVMLRQEQALKASKQKALEAYIISDFQTSTVDIAEAPDSLINYTLIPLEAVQLQNVYIDTAFFQPPVQNLNQPNPLVVRVRNGGEQAVKNIRFNLSIDKQLRPLGTLSIPANSYIYDTVDVPILRTGWFNAKLSVNDLPIEFDNDYHFTFSVREKVNVLQICEESLSENYIKALYASNDYFELEILKPGQLDYGKFSSYNLIVLNNLNQLSSGLTGALSAFVKEGGNVLLLPGVTPDISSYNELFKRFNANQLRKNEIRERKVSYVNFDEYIFNDVFEQKQTNLKLPITQQNLLFKRKASSEEEVILRYRDGNSFVSKYRLGKGNFYVCATTINPEFSNLVNSGEIFVPMLYKMALAKGATPKIAYTIGRDQQLETLNQADASDLVYKLKGKGTAFIPEQRTYGNTVSLGLNNQIDYAGIFKLYLDSSKVLNQYAFNYDRIESQLNFLSLSEIEAKFGSNFSIIEGATSTDFSEAINYNQKGAKLWKWCLLLALAFLALEVLLLSFWNV